MFRRTKLCTGLMLAFGGIAVATPAVAQQPATQRVEITGSSIKRVDAEGPLPVQVVTRDEIDRRGGSTLNEIINNLTSVGQGSFGETQSAGNSFAPGTAAASLRGLGSNATLVLVNGRRMANYGFAQNLDEAFVDLNSIPTAAIERIEILKDGASAIYGSDALAGVINVILRKDFRGVQLGGGAGTSQQGGATEYNGTLSAGFGDLASNRFNVFGVLSYYNREKLSAADRDFSKNPDQTSRGGFDFRSPTGNPGTWLTGGRGGFTDNTVFPTCPESSRGTFSDGRSTCFYNFAPDNWLLPETDRIGVYSRATFEFAPTLTAFAEVGWNKNSTNSSAAPTPGSATLPVGHVSNPFPFVVPIRYRYVEVGPRLNEIETEATRVLAALQGEHFGWSWEIGAVHSKSETTNTGRNYISQSALTAAIPSYNFADLTQVPKSVIDGLRIVTTRVGESELKAYDFKASRDLFAMPGGTAAIAFGVDRREESLADTPDANVRAGNVVGSGGTSSAGDRSSTAGFIELSAPLVKGLEAQLAVRKDRYSDFGSATSPKVALSMKPSDGILIRSSYAKGFRAPSLVQLHQGASSSFPSIRDVVRCDAYTAAAAAGQATTAERTAACGSAQVRSVSSGNKSLDAEKSESFNFGIVIEPSRDFSIGVDYYKIKHTNKIETLTSAYILRNAAALAAVFGAPVVNRFDPSERDLAVGAPGGLRGTGADTGVGFLNTYFNAQRQETSGFDFDVRYRWNLGEVGRVGARTVVTFVETFQRELNPGAGMTELNRTWQYPRTRASTVLTWDRGSWGATLVNNYVARYDQFYQATVQKVKASSTWDAQVSYSGIKNLKLTVGGRNILNKDPSFADVDWYGYDSSNNDPRGAFWYARANYSF